MGRGKPCDVAGAVELAREVALFGVRVRFSVGTSMASSVDMVVARRWSNWMVRQRLLVAVGTMCIGANAFFLESMCIGAKCLLS